MRSRFAKFDICEFRIAATCILIPITLTGCSSLEYINTPSLEQRKIATQVYDSIGSKCLGEKSHIFSTTDVNRYLNTAQPALKTISLLGNLINLKLCIDDPYNWRCTQPSFTSADQLQIYPTTTQSSSRHEVVSVFKSPEGWKKLSIRTDPNKIVNIYQKENSDIHYCNDLTWNYSTYSKGIFFDEVK
jgi:hypothetical protein